MASLNEDLFDTHAYVVGGSGAGKSRWEEDVFLQYVRDGVGVGAIDAHGELYNNLVARMAATGNRRLWERIILVEPGDLEWSVGINPLQLVEGELVERKAQFLAGVVARIWRVDELVTARMMRMMQHAFWLLANQGLTLAELPLLLSNKKFRKQLVAQEPVESGARHYFVNEFPRDDRTIVEWTQSTLNKAGQLSTDPELRLLLGQQRGTINFQQILDEGLVLLVNLSKGRLLAENSHILGGFIMAQLQQAALARALRPHKNFRRWVLFADEFHNYTTETIQEILVESRKYKLNLVFSNQTFGYLREMPELQAAILNSVGNLICFRMGDNDAQIFVREVFQPSFSQVKDVRVRYQKVPFFIWEVNQRFDDPLYRSVEETWEYEMRKLTSLANREFWWKQRGPAPARAFRSRYLPDVRMTPRLREQIAEMKAVSNARWARRKQAAEREIRERQLALLNDSPVTIATPAAGADGKQAVLAAVPQLNQIPPFEEVQDRDLPWLLEDETPWFAEVVGGSAVVLAYGRMKMMRVPKPRKRNPEGSFRLSPRDLQMLILIWLCDGIMARRQLEAVFFAGKDKSQARRRLRELYDRVYLNQPHNERQCASAPEHIYWLDRRGYEEVTHALSNEPNRNLKMIRTFNPMILQHHLEVVDTRLKIMADIQKTERLNMSRWVTERQFRAWKHRISYTNTELETVERSVEPDGFFALWWKGNDRGRRLVYSFTLELDRGTEDLERIRDKLLANAAYLDSRVYREALGVKSGRCLMVTTGWERAENMMDLARESGVSWAWYFCTLEDVLNPKANVVAGRLWRRADKREPVSLLPA